MRSSVLVFAVLFVHSFPEGLAIGTAFASSTAGLGPVRDRGDRAAEHSRGDERGDPDARRWIQPMRSSSGPPSGRAPPSRSRRVVAFALVEQVDGLLPVSFAFAAGAMLSLVALEVLPQALARPRPASRARRSRRPAPA